MTLIVDLVRKPPKMGDVAYFVRAALTRPGDIPWILRREAAQRRAGRMPPEAPDIYGLHCLTKSWEAAVEAGVFRAPPGNGPRLSVSWAIVRAPLDVISKLQSASAVSFHGVETDPAFPALSLEAARFGLPQEATDPDRASAARRAFVEETDVSDRLRVALRELAAQPIAAA